MERETITQYVSQNHNEGTIGLFFGSHIDAVYTNTSTIDFDSNVVADDASDSKRE